MSRPLRLEYPGALYHITSRGNERKTIYFDRYDFLIFLKLLGKVCKQYNWLIHAYCLMPNHYHLIVETPDANLSAGMRQLNGVYTQKINYKYERVGHLFQGRYKAILVDKDNYLLELNRYVVLNPVRAKLVNTVDEWRWSSYLYTLGKRIPMEWLSTDSSLKFFGLSRQQSTLAYERFVYEGLGKEPWSQLKQQIYLGNDDFVKQHQQVVDDIKDDLSEIPTIQKRPKAKPLHEYVVMDIPRDEAISKAYKSGGYTMAEIGEAFEVHSATVSRAVAKFK